MFASIPLLARRLASSATTSPLRAIVASYDHRLVRAYSLVRFSILRQPFLEEIDQYLPVEGRILDVGCGFGLFSLFFASTSRRRTIVGVDLDENRVGLARTSASRLGLANATYHHGDVVTWRAEGSFDAIYTLDVLHHVPSGDVPALLGELRARLRPGGVLIIKEVANRPRLKMWFTLALDRLMVGLREPIHYWEPAELTAHLRSHGFDVKRHRMRDILPYPHLLYVCRLP